MLKSLTIDELEVGMYVKDIILKNSNRKVKNQGVVNSKRTIDLLKKQGVEKVVIECDDEDTPPTSNTDEASSNNTPSTESEDISVADEFARSCEIYDEASENVKSLFLETSMGKPLSPESMNVLAGEITDSILRNEHAITILTRIRQKSNYQWEHAINCGVLICGFGLYIGLKKETVQEMTLGALLHDIGTAKVSSAILEKNGELTANEMSVVKKHVIWGVELSKRDGFSSPIIVDMLVNHHERLDGSGYPRGLSDKKLSKLSRMTAIVDVYDAMTGNKPYKQGDLPQSVLRHLLKEKNKYDPELVQQFIKYLGIHPVGSLVKLSNDKLAVVIESNRVEPLKPIVKVIYSVKLNHYTKPVEHNLINEDFGIVASVQASDYQINLNKIIREMMT